MSKYEGTRYISKGSGYDICYQIDKTNYFGDGNSQLIQPLINCHFKPLGINPWEMVEAKARFINTGTLIEDVTFTPIDPALRYGVFDPTWLLQEHPTLDVDKVHEFLQGRPECGNDYLAISRPKLEAPWPSYDEFRGVKGTPTPERIAERVKEDGYDVFQVIMYEQENGNRQEVIDALIALTQPEIAEDDELVIA